MLNFQQNGEKMKKYLEILKKCPLFNEISEEHLFKMLRLSKNHCFQSEKTVVF